MNEVLNQIAEIIEQYKVTDTNNGIELNRQLKELTARLYYLETIRTMAHEKYEAVIHNKVKEGYSVARATNEANIEVPEMYKLRRLIGSGYKIVESIRSNLSYLKLEMRNTEKQY